MTTTVTALPRTSPIWLVSVLAGIAASVATELYGLAARAAGVPMEAGSMGADSASAITVGMFAMGTVISVFWGTVLAVVLARIARRPARTYAVITVALTALSLAGPLGAPHTATSTKLMLALAHLVAAAIVIPAVTRRLADGRPANAPGRR